MDDSGRFEFGADTAGPFELQLDNVVALTTSGGQVQQQLNLEAGLHALSVRYGPATSVGRCWWSRAGSQPRRIAGDVLRRTGSSATSTWTRTLAPWFARGATAAWLLFGALMAAWFRRQPGADRDRWIARCRRWRGPATVICVAAVVLLGGLLRFEALVGRYWEKPPPWADSLRDFAETRLHDPAYRWTLNEHPYLGDPTTYLHFAREKRGFYAAHIREPFFIAATKVGLWLTGGSDRGINWVSALFSTLAILATYLAGARAFSSVVGLLAAYLFAVERTVIAWSVEGWRDDTFCCFVLLSLWAMLRLRARPSLVNGVLAGTCCALACLTRITALSFVAPCLLVLLLDGRRAYATRWRAVATAAGVVLLVLGPYLLACWREFGDPFYAINYHTGFYRDRANLEHTQPMKVGAFLGLLGGPWKLLDTSITGLLQLPFENKWQGFEYVVPGVGVWLSRLSVVGLVMFLFSGAGRMLLVGLLAVLLPYSFTYGILGGGEWRFTMPAYPFYLIAVGAAAASVPLLFRLERRHFTCILAAISVLLALWLAACAIHYARVAEDLRSRSARISAGLTDSFLFGPGWGPPHTRGNITVRSSRGRQATVYVPLHEPATLTLRFRIDPVRTDAEPVVDVKANGVLIASLRLRLDPNRIGTHDACVPGAVLHKGRNRIELVSADQGPEPSLLFWEVGVNSDPAVSSCPTG